ncbi:MAG TPA: hypothetical protein VGF94_29940 [Kofleriaceae bacterium]|jgi:hypothetical protein
MRSLPLCALVALFPVTAHADFGRAMIDPNTVDEPCRALVMVPGDARSLEPAVAADLSAASCLATTRTRALSLVPGPQAVQQLNEAIQPSLSILDAVIATGDTRSQILAEHAKADLLSGTAVRLMALAPPLHRPVTANSLARYQDYVDELDQLAQPWRQRATTAFAEVQRLNGDDPDAASADPVVAQAVEDQRAERTTGVARR